MTATQTLTSPASAGPLRTERPTWHLSFGGVLRSEFTKLFTLRSTYWLLGLMIAGFAALSVLYFGTIDVSRAGMGTIPQSIYVLATMPGQMLIIVLGALVACGEYATGAIRSTLAAVPRRSPMLAAKAITVASVSATITLISVGASVLASVPLWGRTGAPQFTAEFVRLTLGSCLFLTCLGLIGLGLGMLIRATPGALCAGLGLVLVVPMVLTGFLGSFEWALAIYRFMPDAQMNPILFAPFGSGINGGLAAWQSIAVLLGWTTLALSAGWWRLTKTDA